MAATNPYLEKFLTAYSYLLNRQHELLQQEIDGLQEMASQNPEESNTWLRIAQHLKSSRAVHQGQFDEAKAIISDAKDKYGPNALLLIDQASIYYRLGEWVNWRKTYDELQEILDSNGNLSLFTRMKSYLNLGKFLEEEAKVCFAKQYYQNACDMAENNDRQIFFEASLQKLRLCATLGDKTEVGQLYTDFLQLTKSEMTSHFQVEVEHSLMLAELCLVGPSHAWTRVKRSLDDNTMIVEDKALILYDFLEECLVRNYEVSEHMLNACLKIEPTNEFEQLIQSVCLVNHKKMSLEEISELSSTTSWACYLRILTLAMEIYPHMQKELKNKIHLLLSALPSTSRHLWVKRLDKYLRTSKKTVYYNSQTRMLTFESKNIDLSRKRGMLTFVEIMSQSQSETVEKMIEKIWDSEFSPDHFHRLRMTAHRMNEMLFDLTSIKKPIQVSSDFVRVSGELELIRVDGSEASV
ncbi:MAG: hypothetical protein HRT45_14075 [Bdellovibrionales bacterium]|nr:hypothetical protein [Bdellovibrionales bacterium]